MASLNKAGIIDVVLTEDSDAFLFGALTVIRGCVETIFCLSNIVISIFSAGRVQDNATVFSADAISENPDVNLSKGGMYLMALLCGCDYNQVSLE